MHAEFHQTAQVPHATNWCQRVGRLWGSPLHACGAVRFKSSSPCRVWAADKFAVYRVLRSTAKEGGADAYACTAASTNSAAWPCTLPGLQHALSSAKRATRTRLVAVYTATHVCQRPEFNCQRTGHKDLHGNVECSGRQQSQCCELGVTLQQDMDSC